MTQSSNNGATIDDLVMFDGRYPRVWFHVAMCEVEDGGTIPSLVFIQNGTQIRNPLLCEGCAVEVDPVTEYGLRREDAEAIATINGC